MIQPHALREKLLESAKLTGDGATPEEIDAAIDNYYQSLYTYNEPHWSLSIALAHGYVRRGRLALGAAAVATALVIGWSLFNSHSGLLSPTARQTQQWNAELNRVESLAVAVKKGSNDPQATARIEDQLGRLRAAVENHDLAAMKAVQQQLLQWQEALDEEYEVRVVSDSHDPKVKSGIDHFYNDKTGKRISGWYLIVQAKAPEGKLLPQKVTDAETGKTETVTAWGESVPDEVWERLKADKKTDGILDETLFAVKKRGQLTPQIVMKGVLSDGAPRRQITHLILPPRHAP